MNIFIVRLLARPGGSGADQFYYFSSGPFSMAPSDSDYGTYVDSRVINPGSYERHMWEPGQFSGTSVVTVGFIELVNRDGGLDWLLDAAVDGRYARIYYGDNTQPFSTFTQLYQSTVLSVSFTTQNTVQIVMRDEMADTWDRMLNYNTYAGNNALPNGVEGVDTDLKGKYKPSCYGIVIQVTPPCVNTSLLIYEMSHVPIGVVLGVYNAGVAVTAGVQRSNVAALIATAPAAGAYDYTLGSSTEGAYFRLGSSPGNQPVTFTCAEGLPDNTVRTPGRVIQRMMQWALPYDSTTTLLLTPHLSSFDSQNTMIQGFYADINGVSLGEAVDAVAKGVGAVCVRGNDGTFYLRRLTDPTTMTSVRTFTDDDIFSIGEADIEILDKDNNNVPPYSVEILANHYWTVLTGANVAASVPDVTKSLYSQEYRKAKAVDSTVWDPIALTGRNRLSQPLQITSQIYDHVNDAPVEAARVLALLSPSTFNRRYLRFSSVDITIGSAGSAVDLGTCITVNHSRYGLANKKMMVTGIATDYVNNRVELYAWG